MSKETVLVIGGGGREHALAHAFSKSATVFVSPGNAGIAQEFECIQPNSNDNLSYCQIAKRLNPSLVVVGPEQPLANGLADDLQAQGFAVFGPSKACAMLEASKSFMKQVCKQADILTAPYDLCESDEQVSSALNKRSAPFVIKADGLCAGKGVSICHDRLSAEKEALKMLGRKTGRPKFGEASRKIIIEDFTTGKELSIIALCNGTEAKIFPGVRDHKSLLNSGKGPNTGGMGVIGPLSDDVVGIKNWKAKAQEKIFQPLLTAMNARGTPYKGFLYAGIMLEQNAISLLEINVRFGDPEAQAILFGLEQDIYADALAAAKGERLSAQEYTMQPTATVVLAAKGYPENPEKGQKIEGLEESPFKDCDNKLFFAGVKAEQNALLSSGGRVLSVNSRGASLSDAQKKCYTALQNIQFRGMQYRTDIGDSALQR